MTIRWFLLPLLSVLAGLAGVRAAERIIDLSGEQPGPVPGCFRSALSGTGQRGEWRIVLDDAPLALDPLTAQAPRTARVPVIAQVSTDPTDERFPLLILDDEAYGDFTLTLKIKTVAGSKEQMAGVAFRLQDEKNFYVLRISSLGNTFRFYKVYQGIRDNPIGPQVEIKSGVWHELQIQCEGNRIRTRLDDQELIPELSDSSFVEGKIALWTKSDSVSHFRDLKIVYKQREALARALVREAMQRYPRLLGVRISATTPRRSELHVVASSNEQEIGQPAGKYDRECIESNTAYAGTVDGRAVVTLPLHDRNGDPIAAVRVEMKRFPGQTDQAAVGRAAPVIKMMQGRAQSLQDLTE